MENNFFKSALPIWVENRDKEMNVSVELTYSAKDLKNATLTLAGATFYQVYLDEKLLHFGPAKKAIGYAGVDVFPLPNVDEGTIYIRVAGYYCPCYNGVVTSSFVQAEIEQNSEILAATGKGGFDCRLYDAKLQKVMRYSYQRQFSECYDLHRNSSEAKFVTVDPCVTLIPRNVDFADLDVKPARFVAAAPYVMQAEVKHPLRAYQLDPRFLCIKLRTCRKPLSAMGTIQRIFSFNQVVCNVKDFSSVGHLALPPSCTDSFIIAHRHCCHKFLIPFRLAFSFSILYNNVTCYTHYAESFLNNGISVEQLARAMRLGKLGEQIVIKSKFTFSRLQYEGFDIAEKEKYYVLRKSRDDEANQLYLDMLEEEDDGLYIQDIMRGGIRNDDPRIPRNLPK